MEDHVGSFTPRRQKYPKKRKRNILFILVLLLVIGLIGGGFWRLIASDWVQEKSTSKVKQVTTASLSVQKTTEAVDKISYKVKPIETTKLIKQEKKGKKQSQIQHFLKEDRKLQSQTNVDYYFQSPSMKYGDKNYLYLVFSHSELLIKKDSSLTILLDNIPVKSIRLKKDNQQYATVKVPIDQKFLTEGFHKLSISFYGSISEDRCEDVLNPANWLTVHEESYLYLDTIDTVSFKDTFKHFPYPFIDEGREKPIQSVIVVPDEWSSSSLKSVVKLSHSLVSSTNGQEKIPIVLESELTEQMISKNHLIAIGEEGKWKSFIKRVLERNAVKLPKNHMVMQNFVIQAPNPKQLLLITAKDDEFIEERIQVLTNQDYLKQLNGDYLAISSLLPLAEKSEEQESLTLAKIGSDDIMLNSSSAESQTLNIEVPSFWKVDGDMNIQLKLRLSPLLLDDSLENETNAKIGLTVSVNGEPFTISLNELRQKYKSEDLNQTDFISYSLKVPAKTIKEDRIIEVKLQTNFINNEQNCMKVDDSSRWIWVDKDSSLEIPHSLSKELTFKHWPGPFAWKADFSNTLFVPVGKLTGESITNMVSFITKMGQFYEDIDQFNIYTGSLNQDADLSNHHLIFIGSENDLKNIPALQQGMEQQMEYINQSHIVKETVNIISWLEPSTWDNQYIQWVIVQVGEQAYGIPKMDKISNFLLDNSKEGQFLVQSKSGEVILNKLQEKENLEGTTQSSLATLKNNYIVISAIFVIFAIGIVLFVRLMLKRRKLR
ncbi:cellulose biosynthesis cyclic di-GMP-binding regulatory protein BcsB [Peribacillus asahii]|uniref:cellulose biosynthesis cyclic di-GMP-binding regulatory protein BcsB n=1 Tax=Peribacillus asahii TaxID=228899 RepID=UPI0038298C8E